MSLIKRTYILIRISITTIYMLHFNKAIVFAFRAQPIAMSNAKNKTSYCQSCSPCNWTHNYIALIDYSIYLLAVKLRCIVVLKETASSNPQFSSTCLYCMYLIYISTFAVIAIATIAARIGSSCRHCHVSRAFTSTCDDNTSQQTVNASGASKIA